MDLNELTKVMLMLGGFTVGGLTLSACGGGGGGSSGSDGGSSSGEDNSYCTDDSCTAYISHLNIVNFVPQYLSIKY